MKTNDLALIFTRQAMQDDVKKLHADLAQSHLGYFKKMVGGAPEPDLVDFMVCPPSRLIERSLEEHTRLVSLFRQKPQPRWDEWTYKIVEMNVVDKRYVFYHRMMDSDPNFANRVFNTPLPRSEDLCELTFYAANHSTLLAVKFFWLFLGYPLELFKGISPHTGPVRKATKFLWGNDFKRKSEAKTFASRMSERLQMDEMSLNSALWLMGEKIKREKTEPKKE